MNVLLRSNYYVVALQSDTKMWNCKTRHALFSLDLASMQIRCCDCIDDWFQFISAFFRVMNKKSAQLKKQTNNNLFTVFHACITIIIIIIIIIIITSILFDFYVLFLCHTESSLAYVDSVCFGLKLIDTIPYLVDMGVRYGCSVCVVVITFYMTYLSQD